MIAGPRAGLDRLSEGRVLTCALFVVIHCDTAPLVQEPIKDPTRFPWHEVRKVQHHWLGVDALTSTMRVSEPESPAAGESPTA